MRFTNAQVRERLRVSLERVASLEEQLVTGSQDVGRLRSSQSQSSSGSISTSQSQPLHSTNGLAPASDSERVLREQTEVQLRLRINELEKLVETQRSNLTESHRAAASRASAEFKQALDETAGELSEENAALEERLRQMESSLDSSRKELEERERQLNSLRDERERDLEKCSSIEKRLLALQKESNQFKDDNQKLNSDLALKDAALASVESVYLFTVPLRLTVDALTADTFRPAYLIGTISPPLHQIAYITGRAARARAERTAGGEREARGAAGSRGRVAAERRGRVGAADGGAVERAGGERQRGGALCAAGGGVRVARQGARQSMRCFALCSLHSALCAIALVQCACWTCRVQAASSFYSIVFELEAVDGAC